MHCMPGCMPLTRLTHWSSVKWKNNEKTARQYLSSNEPSFTGELHKLSINGNMNENDCSAHLFFYLTGTMCSLAASELAIS